MSVELEKFSTQCSRLVLVAASANVQRSGRVTKNPQYIGWFIILLNITGVANETNAQ